MDVLNCTPTHPTELTVWGASKFYYYDGYYYKDAKRVHKANG